MKSYEVTREATLIRVEMTKSEAEELARCLIPHASQQSIAALIDALHAACFGRAGKIYEVEGGS